MSPKDPNGSKWCRLKTLLLLARWELVVAKISGWIIFGPLQPWQTVGPHHRWVAMARDLKYRGSAIYRSAMFCCYLDDEKNVIIFLGKQWNLTIAEFQEDFRNFFKHAIIVLFASLNHEMWNGNVPRWWTSTGWRWENCVEESPFETRWKVVDDWFFFW